MRRSSRALLLGLSLGGMGLGCSLFDGPTKKLMTLQNSYDFREARYEEACVVPAPPAECAQAVLELRAYEKHLHEAAVALKNGGRFPLQLSAVKADERKVARRKVTQ